jgi:hypothetical protein
VPWGVIVVPAPPQPNASAFFDIEASRGKLTSPVAATFPAVRAETPRNCLRDELVTQPPHG